MNEILHHKIFLSLVINMAVINMAVINITERLNTITVPKALQLLVFVKNMIGRGFCIWSAPSIFNPKLQ